MQPDKLAFVGPIVANYVANNTVAVADIPALIQIIAGAFDSLTNPAPAAAPVKLEPAVPVKKSITPDFIVCLEDGKKFKSLKRHLRAAYNMTPAEYKAKWGLPHDYPMVAPSYASTRSNLAKEMGLGRKAKAAEAPAPAPAPVKASTPKAPKAPAAPKVAAPKKAKTPAAPAPVADAAPAPAAAAAE